MLGNTTDSPQTAARALFLERQIAVFAGEVASWLATTATSAGVPQAFTPETLFDDLQTGVTLCNLINQIRTLSGGTGKQLPGATAATTRLREKAPPARLRPNKLAKPGTFQARDNIVNFLHAAQGMGVEQDIRFETEDLVQLANRRLVLLCLLGLAKCCFKLYGIEPPTLVRYELEIEMEEDGGPGDEEDDHEDSPPPAPAPAAAAVPPTRAVATALPSTQPKPRPAKKVKKTLLKDDEAARLDRAMRSAQKALQEASGIRGGGISKLRPGVYRVGGQGKGLHVRLVRDHLLVRVGGGWEDWESYCARMLGFIAPSVHHHNLLTRERRHAK